MNNVLISSLEEVSCHPFGIQWFTLILLRICTMAFHNPFLFSVTVYMLKNDVALKNEIIILKIILYFIINHLNQLEVDLSVNFKAYL